MQVSIRPLTARRFCSKQPRRTKRIAWKAIGGPFEGLQLATRLGRSTLPIIAGGQAGRYIDQLWVSD